MQVYLDFDGVLCDSIQECFIVSYLAFYDLCEIVSPHCSCVKLWRNKAWREQYGVDLEREMELFKEYRPFAKSAEDFILLQRAIATNSPLANRDEFLFYKEKAAKASDYDQFYGWREKIFSEDPQWWYSLLPLYPGIKDMLKGIIGDERFNILSTKQGSYIHMLLHYHGIAWRMERIKTHKDKLSYISRNYKGAKVIFIDDQIAFGIESLDYKYIEFYLATWGYIDADDLADTRIGHLSLEEFLEFMAKAKLEKTNEG